MADTPPTRPHPVKIRLMGHPTDIDIVADHIANQLTASATSKPYPNRHDPKTVRVYLEVTPQ